MALLPDRGKSTWKVSQPSAPCRSADDVPIIHPGRSNPYRKPRSPGQATVIRLLCGSVPGWNYRWQAPMGAGG